MSVLQQITPLFKSGTSNLLQDEVIPQDAASDSLNWNTRDGVIQLIAGRQAVGGAGAAGKNYGEWTAYRADGTAVRFRKVNGSIQALVGTTWTDVITGLTITADYVASNYQSLAGAFIYFFGVDGIYKVCTANPTDYSALYDASKNFKGYGLIDKARTILWGRADDPTGLYGSYIDAQDGTVYTTVTGEALPTNSGVLAFRSGHTTRTCFGVQITLTNGGEVYTDHFNGVLTGSLGGTGTINYTTGAYSVSGTAGGGLANYQWEDSNVKGVSDFTKSSTRLAGEGFVIRQDAGGDAIQLVLPLNGSYFSLKKHSCYRFALDSTDLAPINEIFRTDIGVSSLRSATATGGGIMYINTANPSKPRFGILVQNPLGDNFDAKDMFSQYDFSLFNYNDALVDTWDRYVLLACKQGDEENDTLLLGDVQAGTVDRTYYGIRTSTKANGYLYGGDPVSKTTYELFTGFDDLGQVLQNYWIGKGEPYGPGQTRANRYLLGSSLKKVRKLRFQGKISPDQQIGVYISQDDGDFSLVGTIRGDGDYVDYTASFAIGTEDVGGAVVGGSEGSQVFKYFTEMKVKTTKFRKRRLKFVALGYGYASISMIIDHDILVYEDKMPRKYRLKQNVSLDGTETDLPNPQY